MGSVEAGGRSSLVHASHAPAARVAGWMRWCALVFASACAWTSAGCGDRSATGPDASGATGGASRVTIYASADDAVAREVLAACAEATGVELVPVFDTEATKTSGLERRIRDERDRPRADLFWSSEGFAPVRLAAEGLVDSLPESVRSSWPERHIDPAGAWFAFAARARVVVSRADAPPPPATWGAFAGPGLTRGSRAGIAIADPRFGTTRAHLAALDDAWRRARATAPAMAEPLPTSIDAWLAGIHANGVLVLPGGNAATVEAVRTGEAAYGFTDTDDALAAIARGARLTMWLPRTLPAGMEAGGTMIVPNTIAIVRGGPAAREAVDRVVAWFVSGAAEEMLCRSASRNLPLVADTGCDPGFAEPDPLAFDLVSAAGGAEALAVRARAILADGLGDGAAEAGAGGSSTEAKARPGADAGPGWEGGGVDLNRAARAHGSGHAATAPSGAARKGTPA